MKRSLYSSQQHQTYLKLQNPYKEIGGKKPKRKETKSSLQVFFANEIAKK